jgi:membrane protein
LGNGVRGLDAFGGRHGRVCPASKRAYFLEDRLLSFALVIGIGFLLLLSSVLSAGLAALSRFLFGLLPIWETLWQGISSAISFGVITILFAMIFKPLPNAKVAWRDVWLGAAITATLFNLSLTREIGARDGV